MEELIKRLRECNPTVKLADEAADALEAQQAQSASLTCERDELRQHHDASMVELAKLVGADVTEEPRFKWVHIEIASKLQEQQERIDELLVTIGANAKMYASEANDRIYRHQAELASAKARIAELFLHLSTMFEAYENGPDCYEDPDECAGHLGKAIHLDNEDFQRIADILNAGETFDALAAYDAEMRHDRLPRTVQAAAPTLQLARSIAPDNLWHWAVTMPDGHGYAFKGGMSFEDAVINMATDGIKHLLDADELWRKERSEE